MSARATLLALVERDDTPIEPAPAPPGYIDGVQVAQLTGSFPSIGAVYGYVARVEKTLGTNNRSIVVDYAFGDCVPAAGYRS